MRKSEKADEWLTVLGLHCLYVPFLWPSVVNPFGLVLSCFVPLLLSPIFGFFDVFAEQPTSLGY